MRVDVKTTGTPRHPLSGCPSITAFNAPTNPSPLPGTKPLTLQGDIASHARRRRRPLPLAEDSRNPWRNARASGSATCPRPKSTRRPIAGRSRPIEPNYRRPRPSRTPSDAPRTRHDHRRIVPRSSAKRQELRGLFAARWPVLGDIHGEGLLLVPTGQDKVANVVADPRRRPDARA